jgi:hypothetical protein
MPKSISEFYWKPRGESKNKEYEVDIWLYDTQDEMLDDYKGRNKKDIVDKDILGIFVPAAMNASYVGSIRLNKELLSKETIIHESFHAGTEVQYHIGRHLSKRYEENIVSCSAHLANKLLDELKDYIKE